MATVTELKEGEPPAVVIGPEPPKITLPALLNTAPRNVKVTGLEGVKLRVPLLVTVPWLLKEPLKVCVADPAVKTHPPPTVKAPLTVQPLPGAIPPVLLMLTFCRRGPVLPPTAVATVPLKFTVPELANTPFNTIACGPVPGNVIVPLLESVPLSNKSPAKTLVVAPHRSVPEISIVPLTVTPLWRV